MARYPSAVWRGDGMPNHGGSMGSIDRGVIHVMQGTLGGTDSWFHDPAAEVSAHFGVGKDGTVYQWVDTSVVAWAEAAYNDSSISIEHEGVSGDQLTAAQADADVELVRWLEEKIGLPSDRAHWFGHGELGVLGGAHPDCPGAAIMAGLPWVLAQASTSPPPNPQSRLEEQMITEEFNGTQHHVMEGITNPGQITHWWQDSNPSPESGAVPGKWYREVLAA
jgi:hypothetical protein